MEAGAPPAAASKRRRRTNHHYTLLPLTQRKPWTRWDVLPFAVLYLGLVTYDATATTADSGWLWLHYLSELLLPLALVAHLALRLACVWYATIRSRVGYRRADDRRPDQWSHVLILPPPNADGGGPGIVPVCRESTGTGESQSVLIVDFRQIRFRCCLPGGGDSEMDGIWTSGSSVDGHEDDLNDENANDKGDDTTSNLFHTLHFPIDLPLQFYTRWSGHDTVDSYEKTLRIFSNNSHPIPIPAISALLSHQLLQPFFLFQLLCVMLWSLDEYWYYAIFTLVMLVLFEWTVAFNRLKSLQRLRETLRPPMQVWVYRFGRWEVRMSNELVTGDVVGLTSSDVTASLTGRRCGPHDHEGGTPLPCDLLLLRGSAVLNEAVLTGESVPQIKESAKGLVQQQSGATNIGNDGARRSICPLDMEDPSHKKSILFGGTLLVNHTPEAPASDHPGVDSIPNSPNNGLIAMVLRTSFDTVQGSLLRTMVNSTVSGQSDGINTLDTYIFVALLLLCAVASSVVVLQEGWSDPTRNRFKLLLHVIIIITSVVPPELPMELSLAVTSSIADLVSRCRVYCTEPWRIPLAGKVDVCCFDKTGTLTSDEMILRGVRLCQDDTNNSIICPELVLPQSGREKGANEEDKEDNSPVDIPRATLSVMVACNGLATRPSPKTRGLTQEVIGDPLERAVLDGCGWQLVRGDVVVPPLPSQGLHQQSYSRPNPIQILHRYSFTSKLRRMSVLATDIVDGSASSDVVLLTKGAPETIRTLLRPDALPQNYDDVARHHMGRGQRVLAMAFRRTGLPPSLINQLKEKERAQMEMDLIFAGFIVLDCPLKPDSKRVIRELRSSGHQVKMITGDAVLTATEVSKQVGIVGSGKKSKKADKASLVMYELREVNHSMGVDGNDSGSGEDVPLSFSEFAFVPIDENESKGTIAYVSSNLPIVYDMVKMNKMAISVTGEALTNIAINAVRSANINLSPGQNIYIDPKTILLHPAAQAVLQKIVPLISVFARHAPRQKEAVIAALNGNGSITLMCGDGTNDVGALKMAHVGISIVSVPDLEAKQREALQEMSDAKDEKRVAKRKVKKKTASKRKKKTLEESLRALAEAEEELNFVALGDASVASPFTSRTMSIKCTKDILQRGRCTLVTMLQIYKILGVNCLVNALVLTRLHMVGVKQGDRQLTAVGLVVAALFYFVTRGQPLSSLSPIKPPSSVLCKQTLISIAAQFAVHFACIMAVTHLSALHLDPDDPSLVPDGPFNPNILNTSTFLVTVLATVNTFVVNYRGRPYMQNLRENKLMLRSVQICYVTLFACALEVFPPLNELTQLTELPADGAEVFIVAKGGVEQMIAEIAIALGFKTSLILFMIIDVIAAYQVEQLVQKIL